MNYQSFTNQMTSPQTFSTSDLSELWKVQFHLEDNDWPYPQGDHFSCLMDYDIESYCQARQENSFNESSLIFGKAALSEANPDALTWDDTMEGSREEPSMSISTMD